MLQAFKSRTSVWGPEHPDTLLCMHNLACILKSQSRDEAISLMEKCLELRKKVLGTHHPHTKNALSFLNEWKGGKHDVSKEAISRRQVSEFLQRSASSRIVKLTLGRVSRRS